jgi:hypothetical protein
VPNIKLDRYGGRSFSRAVPVLWNELPLSVTSATDLKSFKTSLKTHLFRVAYPSWRIFICVGDCTCCSVIWSVPRLGKCAL